MRRSRTVSPVKTSASTRTTQEPKVAGNEIRTRGGVFRSDGQWYHVAYKCVTAPDHMQVLSLRYKIGDRIPKDEWDQYNLYP